MPTVCANMYTATDLCPNSSSRLQRRQYKFSKVPFLAASSAERKYCRHGPVGRKYVEGFPQTRMPLVATPIWFIRCNPLFGRPFRCTDRPTSRTDREKWSSRWFADLIAAMGQWIMHKTFTLTASILAAGMLLPGNSYSQQTPAAKTPAAPAATTRRAPAAKSPVAAPLTTQKDKFSYARTFWREA